MSVELPAMTIITPLSEAEAKRLDKSIRLIVGSISDQLDKLAAHIARAKAGHIWIALGHKSWTAYLSDVAEVGWQSIEERRKIVALLNGEGMSQRAIASVTGVSQKTVDRDLDELSHDDSVVAEPDAKVASLDGRQRPKHPAKPKADVPEPKPDLPCFAKDEMSDIAYRVDKIALSGVLDTFERTEFDQWIGTALCRLIETVGPKLTKRQRNRIAKAVMAVDTDA